MPTKSSLPSRRYFSPHSASMRLAVQTGTLTPWRLTASARGTVAPSPRRLQSRSLGRS